MKPKPFKVAYINGYLGLHSNKAQKLKNALQDMPNIEVYHIPVDFKDGYFDGQIIDEYLSQHGIDLIVGSSMGAFVSKYFAHAYNATLISLNPMIDPKASKNAQNILFDDKFMGSYELRHYIMLNKDDELIPYQDSYALFKDGAVRSFEKGGHRMSNFETDIIPVIKEIIKEDVIV